MFYCSLTTVSCQSNPVGKSGEGEYFKYITTEWQNISHYQINIIIGLIIFFFFFRSGEQFAGILIPNSFFQIDITSWNLQFLCFMSGGWNYHQRGTNVLCESWCYSRGSIEFYSHSCCIWWWGKRNCKVCAVFII